MLAILRFMLIGLSINVACFYTEKILSVEANNIKTITVTSKSFKHLGEIPQQFTCNGNNISPALSWFGVPKRAKSLVLIVDDPDALDSSARKTAWDHWVLYNLPTNITGLIENVASNELPQETLQGKNDWQKTGYKGPCPPIGQHHYYFKVYALDVVLPDLNTPNKSQLEYAMQGHIIGQGALIGIYVSWRRFLF